jgi:hypothetical protein
MLAPRDNVLIHDVEALKNHMDALGPDKLDAMLRDMGMNVEAVRTLREDGPSAFLAEQPGFYPAAYGARMKLVEWLSGHLGLKAPHSRTYAVPVDGFSARGGKKVLTTFAVLPQNGADALLEKPPIITNKDAKELHNIAYTAIAMRGGVHAKLSAILDGVLHILKTASNAQSDRQFHRELQQRGQVVSMLLPKGKEQMGQAAAIRGELDAYDLEAAIGGIQTLQGQLSKEDEAATWASYWTAANAKLFGQDIESMEELLGKLVLAIDDPVRLAHWLTEKVKPLAEARGQGDSAITKDLLAGESVPLVGLVDPRTHQYRSLRYRFSEGTFCTDREGKEPLSWDDVRALADDGRAAPAYILKYLLRAAAGMYIVMDHHDAEEVTEQDEYVRAIYDRVTGQGYPAVHCPPANGVAAGYSFMELYGIGGYYEKLVEGTRRKFEAGLKG